MSKSRISDWTRDSSGADTPDYDDPDDRPLREEQPNWIEAPHDAFIGHSREVMNHPSQRRAQFLADVLVRRVKASTELSEQQDCVRILVLGYSRLDNVGRKAALAVVKALTARSHEMDAEKPAIFAALVKWAQSEASKICAANSVTAGSTRLSVLALACELLSAGYDANSSLADSSSFPTLVSALSLSFDSLCDPTRDARPALRRSAIRLTRRTIRNVRRSQIV